MVHSGTGFAARLAGLRATEEGERVGVRRRQLFFGQRVAPLEAGMGLRAVVQAEYGDDPVGQLGRHVDVALPTAIGQVSRLITPEVHPERVAHRSDGAREGHRAPGGVAVLDVEVVRGREVGNRAEVGGIGAGCRRHLGPALAAAADGVVTAVFRGRHGRWCGIRRTRSHDHADEQLLRGIGVADSAGTRDGGTLTVRQRDKVGSWHGVPLGLRPPALPAADRLIRRESAH